MTASSRKYRYRPDRPYAQLRLPHMSAAQALLVTSWLERLEPWLPALLPRLPAADLELLATVIDRVVRAIWRAHGHAMADHLGMLGVDTPPDDGAVWCGDADAFDPDPPF
jgi:hypothetical protein